ncbi:uncharacterized protein L3040_005244 [Drepanopeziza brunnea f. sp. 'multigermtubi']|nr:hypothetical protein L3040_005244 [Drepanopeziza brunnea f. sp. 'multigermtubi']
MHTDSMSLRLDDTGHPMLPLIMTTASTPATPGPSTPTNARSGPSEKADALDQNIVPPVRPQSTPFPHQDLMDGSINCSQRLLDMECLDSLDTPITEESQPSQGPPSSKSLMELPIEIHECILDHLFGVRASAASRTAAAGNTKILRGWGSALRHSRRREVSELALVSKEWRELVQDRLYRHLKIKATRASVDQAMIYFALHPQLCSHVKHIEFWFPVFQQKNPAFDRTLRIPSTTPDRSLQIRAVGSLADALTPITYQTPENNCTLDEVFSFVKMTFGEACILTLEGGERKKPPMVQHFRTSTTDPANTKLPVIKTIRTLVCKGQWNLIRTDQDFQNIANALPNLNEWHASYAKPKSKSYLSMATILPKLSETLTHLNVCLEADYRRETSVPFFFKKVNRVTHYCVEMAKAIPTLEHLSYTGRVCKSFFDHGAKISNPRRSRLKSIDIIAKNVCRPATDWSNGSGITEGGFVSAFEALVVSSVKSLDTLAALEFLRIRFLDLDFQVPALNPYFQLENKQCTGLWSETIVDALTKARPSAAFAEAPRDLTDIGVKDGQVQTPANFSKTKPLSIKLSTYQAFAGTSGITIH